MRSIVLLLLFTQTSFGLTANLKKDYDNYEKQFSEALKLSDNKAKFLKDFTKTEKELQNKYEQFRKKEGNDLSTESNQMALDLAMLEPLRILADGKLSAESCSDADFSNELSSESDVETYTKLKTQIKKLCK